MESFVRSGPGRNEVFMKYNKPVNSTLTVLSPRELDVASMVGIGEQNKLISSHLSISEKTVKGHLTNIFKKLGLSSRTQLALFMHRTTSSGISQLPALRPKSSRTHTLPLISQQLCTFTRGFTHRLPEGFRQAPLDSDRKCLRLNKVKRRTTLILFKVYSPHNRPIT